MQLGKLWWFRTSKLEVLKLEGMPVHVRLASCVVRLDSFWLELAFLIEHSCLAK